MATVVPFGAWKSPIGVDSLTRAQTGLGQPTLDGADVCWLESRPAEGGRTTLIRRAPDGTRSEATPAPFNVRTRVHEYGGGAHAVRDGRVLAVDFADQRLYRLDPGRPPRPLTPASGGDLRYADMAFDPLRPRVAAVREDHRGGGEPANTLVFLDLEGEGEGTVVAFGHDFFAAPRFSPDGRLLAFLSWDHPNMPWDGTGLWLAEVAEDGAVGEPRRVAGGEEESVIQPSFAPDGRLHFVSDRTGLWSLYRLEADGGTTALTPYPAEFAGAPWVFGQSAYAFADASRVVGCLTRDGVWRLWRRREGEDGIEVFDLPYTEFAGVDAADGRAVVRAGAPDRPAAILGIDLDAGGAVELATGGALPVSSAQISRPEAIAFPTAGGVEAHAFYYPPFNPGFEAPEGELPPLIVRSHGGPTSRASSEVALGIQFWTSRGFAVADVNYGGSTGFGREYRNRLRGAWGVVDVEDCAAAARFLAASGRADPRRLAITGGSAGGYTTLCALAFDDAFAAGLCRYGVSDPTLLAKETHKFESRYLDRLIGPYPERADLYDARSPLKHADKLSCPVIFLQGLEDKIVPPNQAEMMVDALRSKGVPAVYLAFPGEQHGFRRAETIHAVARAELAFLAAVFGFTPADADVKPMDLAKEGFGGANSRGA